MVESQQSPAQQSPPQAVQDSAQATANYTMLQLPNKQKQQKNSPQGVGYHKTVSSSGSTGELQLEAGSSSESPVTPRKASTASSSAQQLMDDSSLDERQRLTSMYAPPYEMVSCLKGAPKPDRIDCYGNDIVPRTKDQKKVAQRITFRDQLTPIDQKAEPEKQPLSEVYYVESYKKFNTERFNDEGCCTIF